MVRLKDGEKKRTIGLDAISRVSLLLPRLSVRLIGGIFSKDATGFERVRFPEAHRPIAGIVLDGRMSATCGRG
jgi:hypothetical protein